MSARDSNTTAARSDRAERAAHASPDPGARQAHPRAAASDAEVRRAVDLFRVLAHPDRLRIACTLGDGRVTTQKELMEEFGWPQSTAARHLAILRNAGLVRARRQGPEVQLSLANAVALDLLDTVCTWVHQESGAASESRDVLSGVLLSASTPAVGFGRPPVDASFEEGIG